MTKTLSICERLFGKLYTLTLLAMLLVGCGQVAPAGSPGVTATPTNVGAAILDQALPIASTIVANIVVGRDPVEMVTIPAGEFLMGSTIEDVTNWNRMWNDQVTRRESPDIFVNELPQMVVYLGTFEIDIVQVTNQRYRACVQAGACRPPRDIHKRYLDPAYDNYPVIQVTQQQAREYCEWRGKRLPTEAEWEKAARGADGRIYPWGDEWEPDKVSLDGGDAPVDSQPASASPYGVLNMVGGPGDWVEGIYRAYPNGRIAGYQDEQDDVAVFRGGVELGLGPPELFLRTAIRQTANSYRSFISFRCVRGAVADELATAIVSSAAPTPLPAPTAVDLSQMVLIPAGEFIMGTDNPPRPEMTSMTPAHAVYLDAFYLDKYEVTWAQFTRFLNQLGGVRWACEGYDCLPIRSGELHRDILLRLELTEVGYQPKAGYENIPATVTWYGGQAYCRSLGKRLPTEAEWEKAARGPEGFLYPWGNEWNWETDRRGVAFGYRATAVGSLPRDINSYGLADMFGNAMEWTADWSDREYYASSPYRNPTGPAEPVGRFPAKSVRSNGDPDGLVLRWGYDPNHQAGFRCAYAP
jgi:formylglycine-generating enzyme required for sulfatase activity